jgi:hypothetical protein
VSHTRVGEQMNAPDGNELRVRTGQPGPAVSRPFQAGPDRECVAAPANPNEHATYIPVGRWGHDQPGQDGMASLNQDHDRAVGLGDGRHSRPL